LLDRLDGAVKSNLDSAMKIQLMIDKKPSGTTPGMQNATSDQRLLVAGRLWITVRSQYF
jgi:hypothetical protein